MRRSRHRPSRHRRRDDKDSDSESDDSQSSDSASSRSSTTDNRSTDSSESEQSHGRRHQRRRRQSRRKNDNGNGKIGRRRHRRYIDDEDSYSSGSHCDDDDDDDDDSYSRSKGRRNISRGNRRGGRRRDPSPDGSSRSGSSSGSSSDGDNTRRSWRHRDRHTDSDDEPSERRGSRSKDRRHRRKRGGESNSDSNSEKRPRPHKPFSRHSSQHGGSRKSKDSFYSESSSDDSSASDSKRLNLGCKLAVDRGRDDNLRDDLFMKLNGLVTKSLAAKSAGVGAGAGYDDGYSSSSSSESSISVPNHQVESLAQRFHSSDGSLGRGTRRAFRGASSNPDILRGMSNHSTNTPSLTQYQVPVGGAGGRPGLAKAVSARLVVGPNNGILSTSLHNGHPMQMRERPGILRAESARHITPGQGGSFLDTSSRSYQAGRQQLIDASFRMVPSQRTEGLDGSACSPQPVINQQGMILDGSLRGQPTRQVSQRGLNITWHGQGATAAPGVPGASGGNPKNGAAMMNLSSHGQRPNDSHTMLSLSSHSYRPGSAMQDRRQLLQRQQSDNMHMQPGMQSQAGSLQFQQDVGSVGGQSAAAKSFASGSNSMSSYSTNLRGQSVQASHDGTSVSSQRQQGQGDDWMKNQIASRAIPSNSRSGRQNDPPGSDHLASVNEELSSDESSYDTFEDDQESKTDFDEESSVSFGADPPERNDGTESGHFDEDEPFNGSMRSDDESHTLSEQSCPSQGYRSEDEQVSIHDRASAIDDDGGLTDPFYSDCSSGKSTRASYSRKDSDDATSSETSSIQENGLENERRKDKGRKTRLRPLSRQSSVTSCDSDLEDCTERHVDPNVKDKDAIKSPKIKPEEEYDSSNVDEKSVDSSRQDFQHGYNGSLADDYPEEIESAPLKTAPSRYSKKNESSQAQKRKQKDYDSPPPSPKSPGNDWLAMQISRRSMTAMTTTSHSLEPPAIRAEDIEEASFEEPPRVDDKHDADMKASQELQESMAQVEAIGVLLTSAPEATIPQNVSVNDRMSSGAGKQLGKIPVDPVLSGSQQEVVPPSEQTASAVNRCVPFTTADGKDMTLVFNEFDGIVNVVPSIMSTGVPAVIVERPHHTSVTASAETKSSSSSSSSSSSASSSIQQCEKAEQRRKVKKEKKKKSRKSSCIEKESKKTKKKKDKSSKDEAQVKAKKSKREKSFDEKKEFCDKDRKEKGDKKTKREKLSSKKESSIPKERRLKLTKKDKRKTGEAETKSLDKIRHDKSKPLSPSKHRLRTKDSTRASSSHKLKRDRKKSPKRTKKEKSSHHKCKKNKEDKVKGVYPGSASSDNTGTTVDNTTALGENESYHFEKDNVVGLISRLGAHASYDDS